MYCNDGAVGEPKEPTYLVVLLSPALAEIFL